jgi:hypothetical protein
MHTLRLKTERLTELNTDELLQIAGGAATQLCISGLNGCCSMRLCTTAISCSCAPTWNCPSNTCA